MKITSFRDTPQERLKALKEILDSLTLDDMDTINIATNLINAWINNTVGVKGYCRT